MSAIEQADATAIIAPERIVVISDDATGIGGASLVAIMSVEELVRRGFQVTLIAGHGRVDVALLPSSIELVTFDGATLLERGTKAALRGLYDSAHKERLAAWIARYDTPSTIYHVHNWHKVLSPSIFSALAPVRRRLLVTAHDYFLACPNGAYYDFPARKPCDLTPLSPACVIRQCDRRSYSHKVWRLARHVARQLAWPSSPQPLVLAPHPAATSLLNRGGLQSVATLRNPVTPWSTTRVEAEANQDVVFVGRLEEDKGIDLLADAARLANIRLTIIGDGPLRPILEAKHPQHNYMGWLGGDRLKEAVKCARFLVVPTRWPETFGLVTLEALTSGIPVALSRTALIANELDAAGLVAPFEPNDEGALAALLTTLSKDDRRIERMSRTAHATARSFAPTQERWCDELLDIYGKVLAEAQLPQQPV